MMGSAKHIGRAGSVAAAPGVGKVLRTVRRMPASRPGW
jgi:hypothetical protein